jgi:serine protease Do
MLISIVCVIGLIGLFKVSHMNNLEYNKALTEINFSGAYSPLSSEKATVTNVYQKANPAVVRVTSTRLLTTSKDEDELDLPEDHPDINKRSRGVGTGCIIDESGYIITNQHVIENAEQVKVRLIDNTELPAEVVGSDKATDIALLKIKSRAPLSVMPLGDSNKLLIGETVVAIGNPYSYDRSLTTGVVSAKGRKVFNTLYEDYIQTDAAINVGNSGGPLLNLAGELIGVNTVIRADANGISFAIPVNQIKQIISQLKTHRRVIRGFLGIQPDDLTDDIRDGLKLDVSEGAVITYVNSGSAAAKAGIQIYDVIVKFAGKQVVDKDSLYRYIAETQPGLDIEIEVIRDNKHKFLTAKLTEREEQKIPSPNPKNSLKKASFGRVGFAVEDKNSKTEKMLQVAGSNKIPGVVITEVDPLSTAADAGLQRGFVITEVNKIPVNSKSDFDKVVKGLSKGDVLLLRVAGDRGVTVPYFIAAVRLMD